MAKKYERFTEKVFLRRARERHGDRYEYDTSVCTNSQGIVRIKCREHGWFQQGCQPHWAGQGCPACANRDRNNGRRLTTEAFIAKARKVHGDRYLYDQVEYVGAHQDVTIVCKEHGPFRQPPAAHANSGTGCPACGEESRLKKTTHTAAYALTLAEEVHGDLYRYDMTGYRNIKSKLRIHCPRHGWFQQSASDHIYGRKGCPLCARKRTIDSNRLTHKQVVDRIRLRHGDRYDLSPVRFVDCRTPITAVCKDHGPFEILPQAFWMGCGCRACGISNGEFKIAERLTKAGVPFVREATFPDLVKKGKLCFDFHLPTFDAVIEFDGPQHFRPLPNFGGKARFEEQMENDRIKEEWAAANGIPLIRIAYFEDIDAVLWERIGNCLF